MAGHYVYYDSRRGSEKSGLLYSPTFTPLAGQCLSFYYLFYGRALRGMNVYLTYPNLTETSPYLWSRGRSRTRDLSVDGSHWRHVTMPIFAWAQNTPVRVSSSGDVTMI